MKSMLLKRVEVMLRQKFGSRWNLPERKKDDFLSDRNGKYHLSYAVQRRCVA